MFDKQYRFTGSHAEKVSALTSIFDDVAKAKLFERNLDPEPMDFIGEDACSFIKTEKER